ncbi:MAG: hypothetical protein J5676_00300 [Bacteroidaceae bacterium]|nr:hypothetical protein [Bacteroidaceae bacterium]
MFGIVVKPEKIILTINGKELDRTHGLDWYDYGARNYDAFLPMFTSIDPMCEKYYYVSPYVYCGNNPIIAIDPTGCDSVFAKKLFSGTIYYISMSWKTWKKLAGL